MSVQRSIDIEDLTTRGLVTANADQTYELAENVRRAIDETSQTPIKEHPLLQSDPEKAELAEICGDDTVFLHKYVAVAQQTPDLPFETQLTLVFVIDQLIEPRLTAGGVPDAFLPVRGTHLRTAVRLHPRAVVYAWRRNCDGCDVMEETLNDVFGTTANGYGLFAVYGSDCAALLQDQFDVHGAPTTLFCANGRVDSRLVGAQYAQSIESEVEMIDQLTEQ